MDDAKAVDEVGGHDGRKDMEREEKKYNGWSNYETWLVNLWMSNDAVVCEFWVGEAKRHKEEASELEQVRDGLWTETEGAMIGLAEQLKADIEEGRPEEECEWGLYGDLLTAALAEVDWMEIADSWLE